jgi:hypothetical protein
MTSWEISEVGLKRILQLNADIARRVLKNDGEIRTPTGWLEFAGLARGREAGMVAWKPSNGWETKADPGELEGVSFLNEAQSCFEWKSTKIWTFAGSHKSRGEWSLLLAARGGYRGVKNSGSRRTKADLGWTNMMQGYSCMWSPSLSGTHPTCSIQRWKTCSDCDLWISLRNAGIPTRGSASPVNCCSASAPVIWLHSQKSEAVKPGLESVSRKSPAQSQFQHTVDTRKWIFFYSLIYSPSLSPTQARRRIQSRNTP